MTRLQCGKVWKTSTTRHHPPALWRTNNWQTIWRSSTAGLKKNTINTSTSTINFLTDRQQLVRQGKYTSSPRTISTGAPQGCVLSPLLFFLFTNNCTSKDHSVKLLKFADDTTVIGLIQDCDESAYRQEVKELSVWCSLNNLKRNTLKTVDYRGLQEKHPFSPPTHHDEQHCNGSGVFQIPGQHHL